MSAQLAQALKSTLRIDYENDTGPGDEGFWEWWSVIDEATGETLCKCDDEATAKRILAALAAHEAAPQQAQAPGWRPIETAPKDGTNVLLVNRKGNIASGLWMDSLSGSGWYLRGGSMGPDTFFNGHHGPTHWMPWPAAPQQGSNT